MTSSRECTPGDLRRASNCRQRANEGGPRRLPTTTPPHAEETALRHLDARFPQTIVIATTVFFAWERLAVWQPPSVFSTWMPSRFTLGTTDRSCGGQFFFGGKNTHIRHHSRPAKRSRCF